MGDQLILQFGQLRHSASAKSDRTLQRALELLAPVYGWLLKSSPLGFEGGRGSWGNWGREAIESGGYRKARESARREIAK